MQVSFTAHAPNHSMLTIQQRLEAAGFTNVHVNAISDSTQPFTRTNPETIEAYEEGKQLMQARYGRFDAMKEARHINPYRDGAIRKCMRRVAMMCARHSACERLDRQEARG